MWSGVKLLLGERRRRERAHQDVLAAIDLKFARERLEVVKALESIERGQFDGAAFYSKMKEIANDAQAER